MSISIRCEERKYPDDNAAYEGKTVRQAYTDAKNLLQIPAEGDIKAQVNDTDVSWDYKLEDGDELIFVTKSRDKGAKAKKAKVKAKAKKA